MQEQEDRFQRIETKIAFQEHLLEALNDALAGQQQQLDVLLKKFHHLSQQIESFGGQISKPEDESPPPHY